MNKMIDNPFRKEQPIDLPVGNLFRRSLTARAVASLRRSSPLSVAEEFWPHDRALAAVITKATVTPAMTSVAGWAAELAQKFLADTLDALGAASAAIDVLQESLVLDWDGSGSISVPAFVATAANSGFVREGDPIPVRQFADTAVTLLPYKIASISALSREMLEGSNAETLIGDALVRSSALALDAAFFDAAAATTARPAGIRNGVSTLTASNNADLFSAFAEDISSLFNSVGVVGGKGPFVFVGNVGRMTTIHLHYLSENAANVVFVASSAAGNDLIAIAPQAIAAAISVEPDVEVVNTGTLVMDTAPGVAGVAGPERGLYQTDSLAIKVRWPLSWIVRDARGVAWLTPAWK